MNNKLSIIVASLVLTSSVLFSSDKKDEQIELLMKRLDRVESELSKFKNYTDEQIDELHIRADDNEFQAALSKIKFGLEFETNVHSFDGEFGGKNIDSSNKWNSFLHLNMDADINDKTTFTGRFSVGKNWGSSDIGFPNDSTSGITSYGGSIVFLERAYVDYKFTDNFIGTIGRQPGTDGPGANLKNNAKRQSTYASLLFNAAGDGIVFTYKPKISGLKDTAFRLGYAKAYQWSNDNTKGTELVGDAIIDDTNVIIAIGETKLPLGSLGNNLLMFSLVKALDFNVPTSIGNYDVGDMNLGNLYFENNNAFGSSFSWFGSFGYSKGSSAVDNSGEVSSVIYNKAYESSYNAQFAVNPGVGVPMATAIATAYANGAVAAKAPGAISQMALNEKSGWAVHLGGRYDFNKKYKLGYEFFHGSRYWYSFTTSKISDPINILNTRGNVHNIYGIYQIDINQFLRLSYASIHYDYTNSGFPVGGAEKTDDKIDHWVLTYNVKF